MVPEITLTVTEAGGEVTPSVWLVHVTVKIVDVVIGPTEAEPPIDAIGPPQPITFSLFVALQDGTGPEVVFPVGVQVNVVKPYGNTEVGLAVRVTEGVVSHALLVLFHAVPEAHVPTTDTGVPNVPPVLSSRVKTVGVVPIQLAT